MCLLWKCLDHTFGTPTYECLAKYVRLGVKNKTFDQYTKACLKDCFDLYSDSLSALDDAVVAFKSKDLDTASINLSATLDNSVTCEDQFKDKKGETSSPLTMENRVYFQLNVISLAFIQMFRQHY